MCLKNIIASIVILLITSVSLAKENLIFAVDIVRHGDRTPEITIPKSPHKWAEGMGQLTARGMQQEFQLGASFRKKYIHDYHLLPKHYQADAMRVFSTDSDRTLMSAQSLLLGLYPLGSGPTLINGAPALPKAFQPIPIHIKPITDSDGKKHHQLLEKYVFSKPQWRKKNIQLKDKFQRWSIATGLNIDNIYQLLPLTDALYIYRLYHLPMPTGLSKKDIEEIIATGHGGFVTTYQTKEVANFVRQTLLANIVAYLQKAGSQTTPLRYVLFSDHDTRIAHIMTTLQKPLNKPPPYASNLNFSLFKTDTGDCLVKTSYNGELVSIPGCGAKSCTLEQFIKLASHTNEIT